MLLKQGSALLGACSYSLAAAVTAGMEDSSAAAQTVSPGELAAAGWHAVRLLPRLAASIATELDDPQARTAFPEILGGTPSWLNSMSITCGNLAPPLTLMCGLSLDGCSP